MNETKVDKFGRSLCGDCGSVLVLIGAWVYNNRIYTDRFSFSCESCGIGFCGSPVEAELHQDGIEAKLKYDQAKDTIKKVEFYKTKNK